MKKTNVNLAAKEGNRKQETIIVKRKVNNFVQIDKAVFEDDRLSFKAKGILGYLLTKPDGWKVIVKDLSNHSTDGERAIYSGLNELKKYGYYKKEPVRDEKGCIIYWQSVVYECPNDEQIRPNSEQSCPNDEQTVLNNEQNKPETPETPISPLLRGFLHVDNVDVGFADVENVEHSNIIINQELSYQDNISINRSEVKTETPAKQSTPAKIDIDLIDNPIIKIYSKQEIADKIDFDELKERHADKHQEIDMLFDIMCEVLTVENPISPTFRISRQNIPFITVKNIFKQIERKHIEYVIHSLNNNGNKYKINKNAKSYLMTALFHSPRTISHYFDKTFVKPEKETSDSDLNFEKMVRKSMGF
jgi:hypothetical protein